MRHAVLHGAGRHAEAVKALDTMLSKLGKSPDSAVRRQSFPRYIRPLHVD